MITVDAALDDLKKIDVNAPVGKVVVEVARILVKMLSTIRSNQLLTDEDRQAIKSARKARDAKKAK